MTTLSDDALARARKIQSTVLQAVASDATGVELAEKTGLSESKISRLKTEHLGDFAAMLAAVGLKVVSARLMCVDPDEYQFLNRMAMPEIARRAKAPVLDWSGVE
ncbi:MAG: hypothetical protein ING75_17000 [Rhodocyclaceae bacterium]|nr:hypothetical protein [Rhodocyclaceae bacterium]